MSARRTLAAVTVAAAALAAPTAAQAATNPYSGSDICGPGYTLYRIDGKPHWSPNGFSRTVLMHKKGQEDWCAATIKTRNVGEPTWVDVRADPWWPQGAPSPRDAGHYRYFAGPVYFNNASACYSVKSWTGNGKGKMIPGHLGGPGGPCD